MTANNEAHRMNFTAMPYEQQVEAIQRMASGGTSDYGIAHATGLAVEQVRRILSPRASNASA